MNQRICHPFVRALKLYDEEVLVEIERAVATAAISSRPALHLERALLLISRPYRFTTTLLLTLFQYNVQPGLSIVYMLENLKFNVFISRQYTNRYVVHAGITDGKSQR